MNRPPEPRCPLCDRPATPEHRPFCSRGCRDRDLLRWLDEGYRLPAAGDAAAPDPPDKSLDMRGGAD